MVLYIVGNFNYLAGYITYFKIFTFYLSIYRKQHLWCELFFLTISQVEVQAWIWKVHNCERHELSWRMEQRLARWQSFTKMCDEAGFWCCCTRLHCRVLRWDSEQIDVAIFQALRHCGLVMQAMKKRAESLSEREIFHGWNWPRQL